MADSTSDLATLARAAKAASSEPWRASSYGAARGEYEWFSGYDVEPLEKPVRGQFAHRAVAEYIAAANPDAILALLAKSALWEQLEKVRLEQAAFTNVSSAERGYEDRQIAGVVRAAWEKQTAIVPPMPVADARRE